MQSLLRCAIASFLCVTSLASAQTATTAPATTQPAPVPFKPIAHIEKHGDGPINMVLIPGLSCDWTVFDAFMKRNAHKYTMYAVTLPGFGGSEAPAAPAKDQFGAWLDNADAAIWTVVEDQKIEKPVIVGHSLGGHLALRLGCEHAVDLRAVVAIDGAPAFPFGTTPAGMSKQQRITMAKQMAAMYSTVPEQQWAKNQSAMVAGMVTDPNRAAELAELCAKVPQTTTVHYMVDLIAADIRDQLPNLTVPTLVTPSAATHDAAMLDTNRKVWTELMTGAPELKFAFFEDTRHFIMDDRPAELDIAIVDFLGGKPVHGYAAPATQPASQPAVDH